MASADTAQTPAIMRGLAGHFGKGRARDHVEHHENGDGGQRQDGDAGQHSRHAAVGADFGIGSSAVRGSWRGILLRFGPGAAEGMGATVKPVAFGGIFGRAVRQSTPTPSALALLCGLPFNGLARREHAVFRAPGSPAQVHPLAGLGFRRRHPGWWSLVINLVVLVGLVGNPYTYPARAGHRLLGLAGVLHHPARLLAQEFAIAFGRRGGGALARRGCAHGQRWRPQAPATCQYRRRNGHRRPHPQAADFRAARTKQASMHLPPGTRPTKRRSR